MAKKTLASKVWFLGVLLTVFSAPAFTLFVGLISDDWWSTLLIVDGALWMGVASWMLMQTTVTVEKIEK